MSETDRPMSESFGITGRLAPELTEITWLANVASAQGLHVEDIHERFIYMYFFQAWCPGCHSDGFPAMKTVKDHFARFADPSAVRFLAVQTVFEGHDANTAEAALESMSRHGLTDIALGHVQGSPPAVMMDYRTGGTPWTVLVGPGPARVVLADGHQHDPDVLIEFIESRLP